MKTFKSLLLITISFSFIGCASAQTGKRSTNKNNQAAERKSMNQNPASKQEGKSVKTIAEGFYESLETPFIFVARSEETYSQLQKIVAELPPAKEIDFTKSAVVAAFAGLKNTGGYSVAIRKTAENVTIELISPPDDAMTTDALTTPFNVSLISVEQEKTLTLGVAENWKSAMREFKVVSGNFESSGGFAGRLKKFSAGGTVNVLTFENYATLFFDLAGEAANKNLRLKETASGSLQNGEIKIAQFNAGSFSEGPKPPLKAFGKLTDDKLSLKFDSLPAKMADGFQVNGVLQALKNQKKVPAVKETELKVRP